MKSKKLWIIVVAVLMLLLFPKKYFVKDGGTIMYKSAIYTFEKVNSLVENGVERGYRLKIFGIRVYNDTEVFPFQ